MKKNSPRRESRFPDRGRKRDSGIFFGFLCFVEKVDSPIGDENHSSRNITQFLYIVEKVDSPIGDENS